MPKVLQLDSRDNVLIALTDLRQGETVEHNDDKFTLVSSVPAKHKFAIGDLSAGARVTMYGVLVGKTSQPVRRGELYTTASLHHQAAEYHEKASEFQWRPPDVSCWKQGKFMGFARSGGQVGTRNYWLVVPLVFRENRNILNLKQAFEEELVFAPPQLYRKQVAELAKAHREGRSPKASGPEKSNSSSAFCVFPNVDCIKFLLHEGGCGGTREDSNNLCGLISGYLHNPNVAVATGLSLGCQHAQRDILRKHIEHRNPKFDQPLVILEQQQSGSEFSMLSDAIAMTYSVARDYRTGSIISGESTIGWHLARIASIAGSASRRRLSRSLLRPALRRLGLRSRMRTAARDDMTPLYRQWLDSFPEPEEKLKSIAAKIPLEKKGRPLRKRSPQW